jgi:hypothetical protein
MATPKTGNLTKERDGVHAALARRVLTRTARLWCNAAKFEHGLPKREPFARSLIVRAGLCGVRFRRQADIGQTARDAP